MKKILIAVGLLFFCIVFVYFFLFNIDPTKPEIKDPPVNSQDMTPDDVKKTKAINEKYKNLSTLNADAEIIFKKDNSYRLTARIFCEKPRNFRILIKSFLFEEADVGCNNEHFWYWFARQEKDTVFYESYEKAKTSEMPFNPVWLSEIIAVVPFDTDGKIIKNPKYTALVKQRENYLCATIFDKEITTVKGHYLYLNNELVAFCDIKTSVIVDNYELPNLIILSLPKENIYMEIKINNYKINQKLKEEFIMPTRQIMKIIR